MAIHLVTTVGCGDRGTIEATLRHYKKLGVDACHVTLLLEGADESAIEPVTETMRDFGCPLYDVMHCDEAGDWNSAQQEAYAKPRREYPRDWFILAGSGELQSWPAPPADLARMCDSNDWECVYGGVVDRIAADGVVRKLDSALSLEEQFPLGVSLVTAPMVALVRGAIRVTEGRCRAPFATFCPSEVTAVPVFRYQWHEAAVQELRRRNPKAPELEQLIEDPEGKGAFDIANPALRAAPCLPDYPYWGQIRKELKTRMGERL